MDVDGFSCREPEHVSAQFPSREHTPHTMLPLVCGSARAMHAAELSALLVRPPVERRLGSDLPPEARDAAIVRHDDLHQLLPLANLVHSSCLVP